MKTTRLLLASTFGFVCAFSALTASAQENSSLPIPVSIDGQRATAKAGEPFAKLDQPVSSSAPIEVTSKAGMIIINVTPYDTAKKEPVPGAATAIIMLQGTQKGALDKTMDSQKLKPGSYLMSVVADDQTDSILLQVK